MSNQCSMKENSKNSKADIFGKLACAVASTSGKPVTFLLALGVIVVWAITGPIFKFNDTWQLVINTGTTIVTFLMVFLIQNTQNRESVAVQLKLDEIIRAIDAADNKTMTLEEKSQDELEAIKGKYSQMASESSEQIPKRNKIKRA